MKAAGAGEGRAASLHFAQSQPGTTEPLPDQTFLMLSKKVFADLRAPGRYTHDQTVYVQQNDPANPLLLNGQLLDVLHLVAQGDPAERWILNNPDFPVICRVEHHPLGVNLLLSAIK